MKQTGILALAGLSLAGCASDVQWQRIGPGLELAQAQAYCDTASMAAGSGYYAQGSPGFVAGAAVGNAIGNAVAQQRVYRNCMTLQGWRPAPKPKG